MKTVPLNDCSANDRKQDTVENRDDTAWVHNSVENSDGLGCDCPCCRVSLREGKSALSAMVERIFDLYDELEKQRVMLSFKGDLSPELISALLSIVERKMDATEPDTRVRKRIFSVLMECLQNLYHHNIRALGTDGDGVRRDEPQGVVMIAQEEGGYSVLTGNYMAKAEVSELKQHLDHVNGCEPQQLRDLYKNKLGNGKFTKSGGGGLGIIDIARKSGQKLEYGFVPLDNDNTFFSLNVNVTS